MFTGIIEEVGSVIELTRHDDDAARIWVRGPVAVSDAQVGCSISVGGVCLSVTEFDDSNIMNRTWNLQKDIPFPSLLQKHAESMRSLRR